MMKNSEIKKKYKKSILLFNLSKKFYKRNNLKKAEELLLKSINLYKNSPGPYINLGCIYLKTGKIYKAEKCFLKAINLKPGILEPYLNLATCYCELYRLEEAEMLLKNLSHSAKALFEDYEESMIIINLSLAFIYIMRKNFDDAKWLIDCIKGFSPEEPDAYYYDGLLYQIQGEFEKAKNEYEKAIELNPEHINAINNLGCLYLDMHQFEKAENYFKRVLELDPDDELVRINLENLYELKNKEV